jgi:hypothetical protein
MLEEGLNPDNVLSEEEKEQQRREEILAAIEMREWEVDRLMEIEDDWNEVEEIMQDTEAAYVEGEETLPADDRTPPGRLERPEDSEFLSEVDEIAEIISEIPEAEKNPELLGSLYLVTSSHQIRRYIEAGQGNKTTKRSKRLPLFGHTTFSRTR